jgi:hypothetical protein
MIDLAEKESVSLVNQEKPEPTNNIEELAL